MGKPILVGLAGGAAGAWVERTSDSTVIDTAVAELASGLGISAPRVEAAEVRRWQADPRFGGSYSFRPPGSSPADIAALAEPVASNIALAGEYTDVEHSATVPGAYRSGIRAARQVLGTV